MRDPHHDLLDGPIPAGAGETSLSKICLIASRAYPRWRGGNAYTKLAGCVFRGLSPLARGKLVEKIYHCLLFGPIPAGAGETDAAIVVSGVDGAYPRWRGGNDVFHNRSSRTEGLSPLARGKLCVSEYVDFGDGPIPAGA